MSVTYTDNSGQVLSAMDAAVHRALEIIGGTAETYAKSLTPVRTGNLRNSIAHAVDDAEKSAVIGTNVEYAPFVELGTRKQSPKPYLRPAMEEHIAEYRAILEREAQNA